jgi:hypothetical protein
VIAAGLVLDADQGKSAGQREQRGGLPGRGARSGPEQAKGSASFYLPTI